MKQKNMISNSSFLTPKEVEMVSKKTILGFTGLLASGKGTTAAHLEKKYGAANLRFSTILRQLCDALGVEQNRDNLIKMSEAVREKFGEDVLAKALAKSAVKAPENLVVVEGIRRMADIEHLAKLPGFVLVEIFADPEKRHSRLILRGENADDKTKTYEEFLADHKRSTEMSIPEVVSHATEHVDNNGSLEELHGQLDALVKKYGG